MFYKQFSLYAPFLYYFGSRTNHLNETVQIKTLDQRTGAVTILRLLKFPNSVVYNHDSMSTFAKLLGRVKFFNYFYVRSDDYLITMENCNSRLASLAFVNIRDFRDYSKPMVEVKIDDYFHQYVALNVEKVGRYIKSKIEHPNFNMTFDKKARDNH